MKIECLRNEDLSDYRLLLTYDNHLHFKGLLKRLLLLLFLTTNTFHQHQEFWNGLSQNTNALPVYAPRRNHRKANQKMNPTRHQKVIFWWMFLISQWQTLQTYQIRRSWMLPQQQPLSVSKRHWKSSRN